MLALLESNQELTHYFPRELGYDQLLKCHHILVQCVVLPIELKANVLLFPQPMTVSHSTTSTTVESFLLYLCFKSKIPFIDCKFFGTKFADKQL